MGDFMKFKIAFYLLIIAASIWGNSIFSFDGMPLQYYGNDVYGMGMGDTGISDLHRINPNFTNPSVITSTNKVLFSTAANLGYIWYKDADDNTFRDDGLVLPYFQLAVPLQNHRLGFSFNSIASGDLENVFETQFITTTSDTLLYSEINRLSSSLFKGDLIYGYKNHILNIGIAMNYYLGHRVRYWKQDFESSNYVDTKYEIEKNFKNPGFTVGASKKCNSLSLALSYSNHVKLEGDVVFKYGHQPLADTLDLADDYVFEVPAKISGGITYKFLEKYKASVEGHYEMWEETSLYDKNTYKIGFGLGYDPLSGYGNWFERIPLRCGAYIRELPFNTNQNRIMEQAFTFGTSIPLKSANKTIEIAVQYTTRGNIQDNELQDKSLMFTFGITGFDIFKKRLKKIQPRDIPEAEKQYIN